MTDVLPRWAQVLATMAMGALLVAAAPPLIEGLVPGAPVMWWLGRASGLLAYAALWLTMVFGVLIGSRGAGGWLHSGALFELHKAWSLIALLATGVHVLALVFGDHAVIPATAALVPLASPRLTGAVTLGTVALWGLVAVVAATAVWARLPRWIWRAVHAGSFGVFLLALLHGVLAGTDTATPEVRLAYAATGVVLLAAILHRLAMASIGRVEGARAR